MDPIAEFFVGDDAILLKIFQRAFSLYTVSFLIMAFMYSASYFYNAEQWCYIRSHILDSTLFDQVKEIMLLCVVKLRFYPIIYIVSLCDKHQLKRGSLCQS